jgi:hypothetical protein
MQFDTSTLLAGLLMSSIGFVLFSYGKKMSRTPHLITGLILLGYAYFISNPVLILIVGAALLGLLWLAVKRGY